MKDIDVNVFLCKYAQDPEVIRVKANFLVDTGKVDHFRTTLKTRETVQKDEETHGQT